MEWLKQIAPTIATCLGGPLAGLAVSAISKALDIAPDDVQNVIDSGKLSADQIAQIKVAELGLQKSAQELGLNFEELAVEDRKSARDMQSITKSSVPAILSYGITVGFFGILTCLLLGYAQENNQPLLVMLGSLGTAWICVVSFWFGSTNGSQKKDQMLFNSTPSK